MNQQQKMQDWLERFFVRNMQVFAIILPLIKKFVS